MARNNWLRFAGRGRESPLIERVKVIERTPAAAAIRSRSEGSLMRIRSSSRHVDISTSPILASVASGRPNYPVWEIVIPFKGASFLKFSFHVGIIYYKLQS